MKISKQSRRDAKALFLACRREGVLDEARVREAVKRVIADKPRGHVGTLTHLLRLVKLDVERRTARVESAVELDAGFRAGLEANLVRKHGNGLAVQYSVNPSLVGGLRIQVGSDVYDGSVSARLNAMAEAM